MKKAQISKFIRYAAIFANGVYVLWILFNGMDEGYKATIVQKLSYTGIILLLILNIILLGRGLLF